MLNTVPIVCKIPKMGGIYTRSSQFLVDSGLFLVEESMERVLARFCQVLEALGTGDGSYVGQIRSPLCSKWLKWEEFAADEASSRRLVAYSWMGNPSRGY